MPNVSWEELGNLKHRISDVRIDVNSCLQKYKKLNANLVELQDELFKIIGRHEAEV